MSDISSSSSAWKSIRFSLIVGVGMTVGGLLLSLAKKQGLIDLETTVRGSLVLIGMGLAVIGNRIPKRPDGPPPPTLLLAALRQTVLRVSGWSLTLGGLAFAGLSAFAPLDVAHPAAMAVLAVSLAVMCGFVTWGIFAHHRRYER